MIHFYTRTVSSLLAFGFFFLISCSTPLETLEEVRTSAASGNYERALTATNQLLESETDDDARAELLFLKSEILYGLAQQQRRPANRFSHYREMRDVLDDPLLRENLAYATPRQRLILDSWHQEMEQAEFKHHQSGAQPDPDRRLASIAHYENALVINPDSSRAWSEKATVHYQSGELSEAVGTLTEAQQHLGSLTREMREQLAFLFLEEGQIDLAAEAYQTLLEAYPDDRELKHGLVNAYILGENHDRAIELLRELLEDEPDNTLYHQTLGAELFFNISDTIQSIQAQELGDSEINSRLDALTDDLEEAEELLESVMRQYPDSGEITWTTAVFYKNAASQLMTLAEGRGSNTREVVTERAQNLLRKSIPAWEKVAQRNPENPEIWRSIYQVYSFLDMDEEAEEARKKANL